MFSKLRCLFSFNWFYIALFFILLVFSFRDEILVGRETLKLFITNNYSIDEKIQSLNYGNKNFSFIDNDKIPQGSIVTYNGEIEYIFFHPLVLNSKKILKSSSKKPLYNFFVTVDEFKNFLEKLYENNYLIVDIFDVYEEVYKEGKFKIKYKDLKIPKGKIPFVLFVDDLSYNGNISNYKLVIDESDSKIKTLTSDMGKEVLKDDVEIIPILNNFIEKHPDFSLNGARAVISLTGHNGVFGYSTGKNINRSKLNIELLRKLSDDIFDAKKIADKLKEEGWRFACHTYEHLNFKNVTLDYVKKDLENWFKYVSNIVGNTNIFVYPYDDSINENDERFKYLNSNGFNIFCSSNRETTKYSFVIRDYVDIHRNLICYEKSKCGKGNLYKIFSEVLNSNRKESRKGFSLFN